MWNTKVGSDLLHLAASLVTISGFLTGASSLPGILGGDPSLSPIGSGGSAGTGVLASFSTQVQIMIALAGLPLFTTTLIGQNDCSDQLE